MAFRSRSDSQAWGDIDSDDEAVPSFAGATANAGGQKTSTAAPFGAMGPSAWSGRAPIAAEDIRKLAEESRDGLNLAFKQVSRHRMRVRV